jgi:hypothetical protein
MLLAILLLTPAGPAEARPEGTARQGERAASTTAPRPDPSALSTARRVDPASVTPARQVDPASVTPARRVAPASPTAARRIDPSAIAAARRFLCPHGGAPVRGQRGRCRGGSALAAGVADPAGPGWWDGGIAPPVRRQQPCPAGTVAAPAVARADSIRCLPE